MSSISSTRAVKWARDNPFKAFGIAATLTGLGTALIAAKIPEENELGAEYESTEDFLAGQFFKSASTGLLIYRQKWLVEKARASVVCLHGGGEHSGRYAHIALFFNKLGFNVFAVDHAGHGRSEGIRMHSTDLQQSVNDILQFISQEVLPASNGTPVFLLGHSIGGLLATLVAAAASSSGIPLAAVAVTGPCMSLGSSMQDPVAQAVLPLAAALFPRVRVSGPPAKHLAHSAAVRQQYCRDPLNSSTCTLGFVKALLDAQQTALQVAPKILQPMLILHGEDDQICDPAGSEALAGSVPNAQLQLVPGGLHEILNDAGFETHLNNIADWFTECSNAGGARVLPQPPASGEGGV